MEINLKLVISFLLPAVFMLPLVACGGTAAPLPTYTPYPTYTPAPTPSPKVVVKEVPVEDLVKVRSLEETNKALEEYNAILEAKMAELEATNKKLEDNNFALEATVAKLEATNKVLEDNNVVLEAKMAELKAASKAMAEDTKHTMASKLDSAMKEELLALANNRDAWFLASDITTEALEGLYGSWSVICRNETSLADYKEAVYEKIRPWVLESLEMELKDAQEAKRYYNVDSWSSPWAYVEQTWKLGDKIVLGPELQLYLIESGAWRYHDC